MLPGSLNGPCMIQIVDAGQNWFERCRRDYGGVMCIRREKCKGEETFFDA
jgi:hypothetical protein